MENPSIILVRAKSSGEYPNPSRKLSLPWHDLVISPAMHNKSSPQIYPKCSPSWIFEKQVPPYLKGASWLMKVYIKLWLPESIHLHIYFKTSPLPHLFALLGRENINKVITFFHKISHDFDINNPISGIKSIELSVIFRLLQWYHDVVFKDLCLSLDWKSYFDLDFALKSFSCRKRDVWCVLLTTLWNEPTEIILQKGWVMKLRTIDAR